jgi:hypothetical protein
MFELESQGQGARKRARVAGYVMVWGDAGWDKRVEETRDGNWDIVEARASVAELQDELEGPQIPVITRRPATFPEETLRWVPRKRHNSRWPIEPTTKTQATMVAELQPLVEFEIPTTNIDIAAAQHSPQRASAKQMRRRSTRRLSHRASLAHAEDIAVFNSPRARRTSLVPTSPAKSSPTKKVSASPQKAFTLVATPMKVLFRSSPAKGRTPRTQQTPVKTAQSSPPVPTIEGSEREDSSILSEASVLVFEQPVPEASTEPAYETRRRVSLQNAMRLERRSSGGRRSLDFSTAQTSAPNRRHSGISHLTNSSLGNTKNRRHTVDFFTSNNTVQDEMEHDEEITTGFSSAETTENIPEVVVDVCANLDIFGQKSGVTKRRKARSSNAQQDALSDDVRSRDDASSTQSAASRHSHDVDDSPLPIGLGITLDTTDDAIDGHDQAAMLDTSFGTHSEDGDKSNTPDRDFWLDDGIGSTPRERTNVRTHEDEVSSQEDMFAPHDPEGLSTIFEDEEASFTELVTSPRASEEDAEAEGSPTSVTIAAVDAHSSPASGLGSSDKFGEEMTNPGRGSDGAMKQSFDFTMDADDVVHQKPSNELEDASVAIEGPEDGATEESTMPSSPLTSTHNEQVELESLDERSEFQTLPRENDDSSVMAEDFHAHDDGTMVVEDFPPSALASLDEAEGSDEPSEKPGHGGVEGTRGTSPVSHVEVASSPRADVEQPDELCSTPPRATTATAASAGDVETVLDTPPTRGFTPVNSDSLSPPGERSPSVKDVDEEDQDDADDLQDEDMALAMDYEPTVPINLDEETNTVEASKPESEPAAPEEESEAEMLRKFVTRVSANKAAAALAKRNLRPKRRSGSTGSTTSGAGSPAAKSSASLSAEAVQRMMTASMVASPVQTRRPLGEKDANSPSPTKKRKVSGTSGKGGGFTHPEDLYKGNPALYSAEISPPKSKRLRSRRRVEAESDDTADFADFKQASMQQAETKDGSSTDAAPRRSTRSRSSRVQLKPPAPSANSIALSLIPVRLPGSSSGMILSQADISGDKDMPTPVVVARNNSARSTAAEKDLAAVTRVNTRKNKGGAMPPSVVLGRQAEDPLGFKLRELKGVFDAKEDREGGGGDQGEEGGDGRKSRQGKGVRWASELVRFNTDFEVLSPRQVAVPLVPVIKGAKVAVAGAPPHETVEVVASPTSLVKNQVPEEEAKREDEDKPVESSEEKKVAPAAPAARRTRQSRLQAPTPVSKKILADTVSSAPPATTGDAAAKVMSSSSSTASGSVVKMATRRTKIASLGMGVNGTPAPKRRTRA